MENSTRFNTSFPSSVVYDIAVTLIDRLGPKTIPSVIEAFGGSRGFFEATDQDLRELELTPFMQEQLVAGRRGAIAKAESIYDYCNRIGVRILIRGESDYPALLDQCSDAPHALYVRGDIAWNNSKHRLAVVGTRQATPYGVALCQKMIHDLSIQVPNTIIVSGLAFGIDKAAHTAALENNLSTVAVMAGWVDEIVPRSHYGLARQILSAGGAIISDMPPDTVIKGANFLSRNRIIAGISHATLVAQSALKGGSMVTADIACSYNRDVFAPVGDSAENFAGNHHLIKTSKASLCQNTDDLTTAMNWNTTDVHTTTGTTQLAQPDPCSLSAELLNFYSLMPDTRPTTVDEMAECSANSTAKVSTLMTQLELSGFIRAVKGRMYQKYKW